MGSPMYKPSKKKSVEDLIASLPDKPNKKIQWTMAEDAAILKYCATKGCRAIGKALGKNYSTVQARYNFLKAQAK